MVIIKADVLSVEKILHLMIQDDVFGYSCLQTMLFGEQPKFVGQYLGLFDVVGG